MKKITFLLIITLLVTGLINAQMPTEGLVAYYPFNGNANDESVNENNGTVNGATLSTDRFGNESSAYNFNGTNNYISVDAANFLNNNYTYVLWFKSISNIPIGANSALMSIGESGGMQMVCVSNQYVVQSNTGTGGIGYSGPGANNIVFDNIIPLLNEWNFVAFSWSDTQIKLVVNDNVYTIVNNGSLPFYSNSTSPKFNIGCQYGLIQYFTGQIDDIRIYNRSLNQTEITALYNENLCSDVTVNLTTDYSVSDIAFESISPKLYLNNVENLYTTIGGCDSTVNHYNNFIFNPTYYTDTITVTDTLIINVTLTGINPPNNLNTIKVYPNPAVDYVIINTGEFGLMSDYEIKIENSTGQTVYQTQTNQSQFQISVNQFGGYGLYFVKVIDNLGNVIVTRKLILE